MSEIKRKRKDPQEKPKEREEQQVQDASKPAMEAPQQPMQPPQMPMQQMMGMVPRPMAQPPMMAQPGVLGQEDESLPATAAPTQVMIKKVGEDQVRDAYMIMRKYKAGKARLEQRIQSAQRWWKLRNWEEIERETGIKGARDHKGSTAWLWNCVVGKHADSMDSFPEPVILPRVQDDKEEASRLSSIVPVVLQQNGFEEVYSEASWQKFQEGTGVYGVFWDKSKLGGLGDIAIRRINTLNLFWEPGIRDIQDSRHVFHATLVDNDELEDAYPQLRGKLGTSPVTLSTYAYDDHVDVTGKSMVVDWYYHRYRGGKKVLHFCKFVGTEVLYATENDPQLAERGLYDDGLYPFVMDALYPVEGSPCGYGLIDIGKDTQTDIDTISQALIQASVVAATPRYFVRKDGSINEEEFANWSKPFVHVNGQLGQDSILPITPAGVMGNAADIMAQKIEELKFVTGNVDVSNGSVPSGVTAASAIAALKEDAGRSSKDANRTSYRAFNRLVTMVIERIRQFYDMPRQFRITGERGEENFVSYSNVGLKPLPLGNDFGFDMGYRLPVFDIEVRAQRETSYTKVSQNELALQFYQLGMFNPQMIDQSLMTLDMMDFKGKEEIQQKLSQMGTMQQLLMQFQQIALALAQKYEPQTAQQLAQITMGMQGGVGVPGMAGNPAIAQGDEMTGSVKGEEPAHMRKAKERVANASRPG